MNAPVIELIGLPVRAPVSALTNLFLVLECGVFARALQSGNSPRRRLWVVFFGALGLAALAGVFKHGVPDGTLEPLRSTGHALSNVATGASATVLVVTLLGLRMPSGAARRWLVAGALVELTGFSLLTVHRPAFTLVALHSAALLIPVMVVELGAWRRGSAASGWIFTGLLVSCLTGVVYGLAPRVNVWIDHIDVSHALLALSFLLLFRGAAREEHPWTA